jgi:hypothetical protein
MGDTAADRQHEQSLMTAGISMSHSDQQPTTAMNVSSEGK